MNRILLSAAVILQLKRKWTNDPDDCAASMITYYNCKGWKLRQHSANDVWSIPESQLTFLLLSL